MSKRFVKVRPATPDPLGVAHVGRYMTENGFSFACGKCGSTAEISMPADDLAPLFKAFLEAHRHEVLS